MAAFMLGMKEYFGNVDHLRAAVSEVPVPDAEYRKQYLVIYDSVPGGTGYLKQLALESKDPSKGNPLVVIFEKALHVMENCSCKDDPLKDGCYHCLYAYRQSRQIGSISRTAAVRMLKAIISGKDNVDPIQKINDIPVNPIIESELEHRFIEAVCTKIGTANVIDVMVNGKHGYRFTVNGLTWEIEPQVLLDAEQGVKVKSKPDFMLWPVSAPDHLPVAVFTDGFTYHKDIVADDTLKREAIRRSGKFRVWSLSFKDVQNVFASQGGYATDTLDPLKMPFGMKKYSQTIKEKGAEGLEPGKIGAFELMMEYLSSANAEQMFRVHAYAYGLSLLEPARVKNNLAYTSWFNNTEQARDQTHYTDTDFVFPGTMFGTWIPRTNDANLAIYAGVSYEKLKMGGEVAVCAVLDDENAHRSEHYESEWNGMLQFSNIMQFGKEFIAVSKTGLKRMGYLSLPHESQEVDTVSPSGEIETDAGSEWQAVMELLFDEEAKSFAQAAAEAGIPAPSEDDIGYEIEGPDGEVIATVEIAWPQQKIGFMTVEQIEEKDQLEQAGWKIVDLINLSDAVQIFGGEDR